MKMKSQRRIAASILKVGKERVWFDPSRLQDIKDAITKEDVRSLIKEGAIKAKPIKGISKGRFRKRLKQKQKGLRRGVGSRKGKRVKKRKGKKVWVRKVRALRRLLRENKERINKEIYWDLRKKIKAGSIKSKKHLVEIIKEVAKEK